MFFRFAPHKMQQ